MNPVYDYMRMDFGVVTNTGNRDSNDDNTIVIEFRAVVVDSHATVVTGDAVTVAAGIRVGTSTVWVGTVDVDVVSEATVGNDEVPSIKRLSAMNERDQTTLYQGASTGEFLLLTFPAGAMYQDVNITVTSSTRDASPVLHLCGLEVYQFASGCHQQCGVDAVLSTSADMTDSARVSQTDVIATTE